MVSPKSDADLLLNFVLRCAESLLAKYGEFYPFGGAMNLRGDMALCHVDDSPTRSSDSEGILRALEEGFRTQVADLRALATVCLVRVAPPNKVEEVDAVRVHIEHRDCYSAMVFVPYHGYVQDQVEFGDVFAARTELRIFVPTSRTGG
jgi:hypothetical protein